MTVLRKAARGVLALFMMYFLAAICAFFFRILLTRQLTVEDYGLYYSLFSLFSMIFIIRDFGTQSALVKFIPGWLVKNSYKKIKFAIIFTFSFTALISSILFLLTLMFSATIQNSLGQVDISTLLLIFAAAFGIWNLQTTLSLAGLGFQRAFNFAVIGVIQPLILVLSTFVFFSFYSGLISPAFGLLLSNTVALIIWAVVIYRLIPSTPFQLNIRIVKTFFSYGSQVFIAAFGPFVLQYTDSLMITWMKSVSDVGIYNAALPLSNLLLYIGTAIATITLPLFSEFLARNLKQKIHEAFRLLYTYAVVIALPSGAILFTFSDLIITLIFSSEYISASSSLRILTIGTLMNVISQINLTYLYARNEPLYVTKFVGIAALINIILNYLLIPSLGILGAAIGTSVSFGVLLFLSTWHLYKHVSIHPPFLQWGKNILCAVVMILAMFLLKSVIILPLLIETCIVFFTGIFVYILFLFILKVLRIEELKDLARQIMPSGLYFIRE